MSKGLLEPTLKKFFSNYDSNNVDISLFKGEVQLNNMFLRKEAINEILSKGNTPFNVVFGMVTKIHIKVSIMGLYIELMEIEDLILVVSPDPTKGQTADSRFFESTMKEELLMHMVKNFENIRTGTPLVSIQHLQSIPKEIVDGIQKRELEHRTPFHEKGPLEVKPETLVPVLQEEKPNFMGPEIFALITGRLDFNIRIRNVRLYYEDNTTLVGLNGIPKTFSFCLNITGFTLNTKDVRSQMMGENFKDLFNLTNLMDTLSPSTKLIYLNTVIERLKVEVYLGSNPILPPTIDKDLTVNPPSYYVDYFYRINTSRQGDHLDLFVMDTLNIDIILGHDTADTSTVPIQGLIFYLNFKDITFNFQLGVMSEITAIANYASGLGALKKINDVRPPISVMSKSYYDQLVKKHNLTGSTLQAFKTIQRELIRESMALAIWRDLTIKYSVLDNLDVKRRLIFRYKLSSLIFQLYMGCHRDTIKKDLERFVAEEAEYLTRSEEINKAKMLQDPTVIPANPNETQREKANRMLVRLSKKTWKFHIHFRLHANLYINMLDTTFTRDLTIVMKGLDINIVKPRGRFHSNSTLMIKNLLVAVNTNMMAKPAQRSIFDFDRSSSATNKIDVSTGPNGRASVRSGGTGGILEYVRVFNSVRRKILVTRLCLTTDGSRLTSMLLLRNTLAGILFLSSL